MQRSSPCGLGRPASASAAGSSADSVQHAQARTSTCDRVLHFGEGFLRVSSWLTAAVQPACSPRRCAPAPVLGTTWTWRDEWGLHYDC